MVTVDLPDFAMPVWNVLGCSLPRSGFEQEGQNNNGPLSALGNNTWTRARFHYTREAPRRRSEKLTRLGLGVFLGIVCSEKPRGRPMQDDALREGRSGKSTVAELLGQYITMAGDTRDSDPPASDKQTDDKTKSQDPFAPTKKPKHEFPKSQVGKLWEAFGNPEEPINLMAPNAKQKDVSLTEVIKSISWDDFTSFYKAPCARESLLTGLGTGFCVGGIRAVLGGEFC